MLQYFDIHLVKYPTSTTPAVTVSTNSLVYSSTSGKKGQTLLYKLYCICLTIGCGI